jgi:hypothetical protein
MKSNLFLADVSDNSDADMKNFRSYVLEPGSGIYSWERFDGYSDYIYLISPSGFIFIVCGILCQFFKGDDKLSRSIFLEGLFTLPVRRLDFCRLVLSEISIDERQTILRALDFITEGHSSVSETARLNLEYPLLQLRNALASK